MDEECRRNRRSKEAGVAAWETIYCALVLILVAFFAMLASYSKTDSKKIEYFFEKQVVLEDPDLSSALSIESLKKYYREISMYESVKIEKKKKGFEVTFESHIFFLSGQAVINKEAYPCLDAIIRTAQNGNFSVKVEGYTDNIPINTSEFPSNWELSTARAVNVFRYLLEKGELPIDRLSSAGFGQYHPVESNDTPEGRQKNRRVAFYFEISS